MNVDQVSLLTVQSVRKPFINRECAKKRLKWAKAHINRTNEQWHKNYDVDPTNNGHPINCWNIAASDLANAFDRAISADLQDGSHNTFFVTGDYTENLANLSRGKEMLDWEPLERPQTITSKKEIVVPEIVGEKIAA